MCGQSPPCRGAACGKLREDVDLAPTAAARAAGLLGWTRRLTAVETRAGGHAEEPRGAVSGPPAAASPRALSQQEHPAPVALALLSRPCPRAAPRARLALPRGALAHRGKRQQCASVAGFGDLFAGRLPMGLTARRWPCLGDRPAVATRAQPFPPTSIRRTLCGAARSPGRVRLLSRSRESGWLLGIEKAGAQVCEPAPA